MNKILSIFVCVLICLSSILILPDDFKVGASSGEGGSKDIGLDYDYMWNITKDLSYIIFNENVYPPSENILRKGRGFGTEGERWTAEHILKPNMTAIGLEEVKKLQIGPIKKWKYKDRYYSSMIEVLDCQFIINNTNYTIDTNGLPCYIPKNETFPVPSAVKHKPVSGKLTYNYSFNGSDNIRVLYQDTSKSSWPLGPYSSRTYYNVSSSAVATGDYNKIIGKVTYVESDENLPNLLMHQEIHIHQCLHRIRLNSKYR